MNSECCICFEIVRSTEKQLPFATRCGHLFHENCIKNCVDSQRKCPQCNQPMLRSQLIRLYINEPGTSIEAKDELIARLRHQLNELNEKAQLQYDLIGALNRQINKEKEKCQSGTNDGANGGNNGGNNGKTIWPAKLNITKSINLGHSGNIWSRFSMNSNLNNATTYSSTLLNSNTSNRRNTLFGNEKVTNSLFTFGDKNLSETTVSSENNESTLSVPLPTFESIPVDAKRELYQELGRLMFGDSELSKHLVPKEPVTSQNIFSGRSNLRNNSSLFSISEGNSSENEVGQISDSTNVTTGNVKPRMNFTKLFDWKPTTTFSDSNLFTASSSDSKKNLFSLDQCNIKSEPSWLSEATTSTGNRHIKSEPSWLSEATTSTGNRHIKSEPSWLSEATTSTGNPDIKPASSHGAKKTNFNRTVGSFPSTRIFTDPTLQNFNDFFRNIPKTSVLSGNSITPVVNPLLGNRTKSVSPTNESSNNVVVVVDDDDDDNNETMPAEKE